jgi:hypothetical protein
VPTRTRHIVGAEIHILWEGRRPLAGYSGPFCLLIRRNALIIPEVVPIDFRSLIIDSTGGSFTNIFGIKVYLPVIVQIPFVKNLKISNGNCYHVRKNIIYLRPIVIIIKISSL